MAVRPKELTNAKGQRVDFKKKRSRLEPKENLSREEKKVRKKNQRPVQEHKGKML